MRDIQVGVVDGDGSVPAGVDDILGHLALGDDTDTGSADGEVASVESSNVSTVVVHNLDRHLLGDAGLVGRRSGCRHVDDGGGLHVNRLSNGEHSSAGGDKKAEDRLGHFKKK